MKSEKAAALESNGSKKYTDKTLTNNMNNTPTLNNFQSNSRRELIELSRLPKLPERTPFRLPELPQRQSFTFDNAPSTTTVSAVCAGCDGKLDLADSIQQRFNSCRKCVSIYGRVEAAVEEIEKRERKEILEKFIGGAK